MCLGYRHLWRLGRIVGLAGVNMNESAFPWSVDNGEKIVGNKGMTLRDYFAAKAMQGAIAGMSTRRDSFSYRECAALCYEMADSMLKERQA